MPIVEEFPSETDINEIQGESEPTTTDKPQNIILSEGSDEVNAYNPAWGIYVGVASVSVFIFFLLLVFFIRKRR